MLYEDAYFQHVCVPAVKDNNYILYLYKTGKDKYLQMAIATQFKESTMGSSLNIPSVKNIQFINDEQKKSKFDSNDNWEKIK